MIRISQLFIYPIKSLGSIAVQQAALDERGLQYDRRFMLVTVDGHCLTQHRCPAMALLDVALDPQQGLRVWHRHRPHEVLTVPLTVPSDEGRPVIPVHVWDSQNIPAVGVSDQADCWFSRTLNEDCRLVFMPDSTYRAVDPAYAHNHESVSFADGYPYLFIGQRSLDDLNQRLAEPVSMARFRPNLVVSGSTPYEEDTWEQFQIGENTFYTGEHCGRCVLTTLDPNTGRKGPEPLRTLATYRQQDNKILFGRYALLRHSAQPGESTIIRVGQAITGIRYNESEVNNHSLRQP
jgi:uncharacterized protein YcbX